MASKDWSDARQRTEREIADRYRRMNRDLGSPVSDQKIRDKAAKESREGAERAVRDERK
jgi:hypothetical protein